MEFFDPSYGVAYSDESAVEGSVFGFVVGWEEPGDFDGDGIMGELFLRVRPEDDDIKELKFSGVSF